MKITSHKAAKSRRKTRSTAESAFEKAWNRVIGQQKKNTRLKEEVQAFSRKVSAAIQDQEKAYVQAQCRTCEHLLSFCSRKSLSLRDREVLLTWIMDYLLNIGSNPFGAQADVTKLHEAVASQLAGIQSADTDFHTGAQHAQSSKPDGETPPMDDMFEELFAEFDADNDLDDAYVDPFAEALFEEFEHQQRAGEARQAEEKQALNEMMKASSISRLFRKVARVLHPDRERDESARQEKNRLMGVLLQARQSNDVPMIFSLYAEHVGESPLQELAGDLKGVTALLQRQYEYLRDEKDEIIEEEPFSAALYRRFHAKSEQRVQGNIREHLLALKDETLALQYLCEEVTSLSKLKPYLTARRREVDLDDYFFPFGN